MAEIISLYTCHEVIVDNNDNILEYHETNLPHGDFIAEEFCKKWNEDADKFLLEFMNKELDNRIESCIAKPRKTNDGTTTVAVHIKAKPGKQLTTKIKNTAWDYMSAQYSDGWGEGFFGMINIMTAPDGTRLYVE